MSDGPNPGALVALEEHFAIPETLGDSEQYAVADGWSDLRDRLLDLDGRRLEAMDRHGVTVAVLSLNSPAVQAVERTSDAVAIAQRANDLLADAIARRPDRLGGFAALPMQDPVAAVTELHRAISVLGFKGVLVNGFTATEHEAGIAYYDAPEYSSFWAEVERLDVPFYLHPRDPVPAREPILDGHPWLRGSAWAFGVETATHALRLMTSGLFDRHPRLQMILGHLGEMLPFNAWRIDHRLAKSPRGIPARRRITDYLRTNVYVTTSGHFSTAALDMTIAEMGADRVLFSVDYPFEEMADATSWFNATSLPDAQRALIASENARRMLRLE